MDLSGAGAITMASVPVTKTDIATWVRRSRHSFEIMASSTLAISWRLTRARRRLNHASAPEMWQRPRPRTSVP